MQIVLDLYDLLCGIRCSGLLSVSEGSICDPDILWHVMRHDTIIKRYFWDFGIREHVTEHVRLLHIIQYVHMLFNLQKVVLRIHADEGSVAEKFAQKLAEQQIPVGIAKVDRKSLLLFYTSLYTMGVNAIQVHVGEEQKMIQLTEFVRRKDPEESKNGKVWVENPELHLTMLYYMQDLRRQPNQEITPELNDLQEEIGAHFTKGRYIVPLPEEGNGIPLVKLKSGDIFQPIFTDVIEFQRFNREKKFRPVVVDALKLAQVLPEEAKGIVLNPLGVNMPLTVQKVKKQPEAPVQKPVSVEAQIDAAIREVQAEAGRE